MSTVSFPTLDLVIVSNKDNSFLKCMINKANHMVFCSNKVSKMPLPLFIRPCDNSLPCHFTVNIYF